MSGRWIEKIPRRSDFCGCPGCPLCYNWVEERPVECIISVTKLVDIAFNNETQTATVELDGLDKMIADLIPGGTPTLEEKNILREAAVRIHVANLARIEAERKDASAYFHECDDRQMLERWLKSEAKERAKPKREPIKRQPLLDEMELKQPEEKKEETEFEKSERQLATSSLTAGPMRAAREDSVKDYDAITERYRR